MNNIFRIVPIEKRLPQEDGFYDTNCGKLPFSSKKGSFLTLNGNKINEFVDYWYEHVQLPTGEEEHYASEKDLNSQHPLVKQNHETGYRISFHSGINYIKDLLTNKK